MTIKIGFLDTGNPDHRQEWTQKNAKTPQGLFLVGFFIVLS